MGKHDIVSRMLRLKKFYLEERELEVKKTFGELNVEEGELGFLDKTFENTVEAFNQNIGMINVSELEFFYNHFTLLDKRIKKQTEIVELKSKELEEKKKSMLNAYKENRILEILDDKIHDEESQKASIAEQKWMDFLFTSKKARR